MKLQMKVFLQFSMQMKLLNRQPLNVSTKRDIAGFFSHSLFPLTRFVTICVHCFSKLFFMYISVTHMSVLNVFEGVERVPALHTGRSCVFSVLFSFRRVSGGSSKHLLSWI